MKKTTESCPICDGGPLVPATYSETFDHRGAKLTVNGLRFHRCEACGADPVLKVDYTYNHRRVTDARRAAEGLLSGTEIRKLRWQLGLTQKQAAALFGGGEKAFAKYESGDTAQSVPMDHLLRVAARFPAIVASLAVDAGIDIGLESHLHTYTREARLSLNDPEFRSRPASSNIISLEERGWKKSA